MGVTWHRLHAFSVSWLHFTCVPMNTTSSSCFNLLVVDTHQKIVFQPGSSSAAANEDIHSVDLPVQIHFYWLFSLIYTNWERAGDSSKQDLYSVVSRTRAPLGRWAEDCSSQGGALCQVPYFKGLACYTAVSCEEWNYPPKAFADLLWVLLPLFSSFYQLSDLTSRFPFNVENCLMSNTTPSFASWLSAHIPLSSNETFVLLFFCTQICMHTLWLPKCSCIQRLDQFPDVYLHLYVHPHPPPTFVKTHKYLKQKPMNVISPLLLFLKITSNIAVWEKNKN